MVFVGTGGKGRHNMREFLKHPDVRVVGICDVDDRHLAEGEKTLKEARGLKVQAERDYRRLLERPDVDAVVVSTPDHWHAVASVDAMNAGADVYCEKPLANSVAEGRKMVDTALAQKRVVQCGSQERSNPKVRYACELVRSGALGTIREVRVGMPTEQNHHQKVAAYGKTPQPTRPPNELDYDRWLGPTPWVPHVADRVHFWWRFVLAYGGGEMTDRGAHILDLAGLALDRDDTTPTKIMAVGNRNPNGLYDAFMDYVFVNEYSDGLRIVGVDEGPRGIEFIGDAGKLAVRIHGGKLVAEPNDLVSPDAINEGPLGRTPSHHRNFLDCMKSRETPMAPVAAAHRTATLCHLNNIAMRLGRPLEFDPDTETVKQDDEANQLLAPEQRKQFTYGA
ncbi:MAG: Gfo/Idh/MocA family oxidoreductase [Planctomycetota bacterium]